MTEDLHLIAGWCCSQQLLITQWKAKLISVFGTGQLLGKVSDITVPFLDQDPTPVSSVKDLGITLDAHLNFNDHVNMSLLSMLRQINRVRHLFSKPALSIILNCLILS